MTRPKLPRPVGLEKFFLDHTEGVYDSLRNRLHERVSETTGKVIRAGQVLPFDLSAFRVFVRAKFFNDVNRPIQCPYCRCWLTVADYVVDHDVPLKQGGGIGLPNLILCCGPCNRIKGSVMDSKRMIFFIELMVRNMRSDEVNDIFGRLKQGDAYRPLVNRFRKFREKTGGAKSPKPTRQPDLFR